MGMKDQANRALRRMTGYELTRDSQAVRAELRREFDQTLNQKLEQAQERHHTQRKQMARQIRRRQRDRIPSYVDETTKHILESSQPRTLTGLNKLLPLLDAVRYTVTHQIPGAMVECGVWRGGSMQAIAWTLLDADVRDRDLHLFDTFEGMSEPTGDDTKTSTGAAATDLLAQGRATCRADLEDVTQGMRETGYPMERIHFHRGLVEHTVPEQAPERIALLRLDTDWYESTKHEFEHLYPRLSPGGVLIIDDFGSWDGARKATLEWLEATGEPLLLVPIGAARLAVKPG